jgi:O-antigen/teichoic acid export membrane protein
MLRRLFLNSAVSGVVFAITSLLVILLIPALIAAYGVAGLGLIMLLRTILPSGLGALLDLGVSEVVTQAVARARTSGNWRMAGGQCALLALVALGVGTVLAVALWIGAPAIAAALNVPAAQQDGFALATRIYGLALPFLFPALVTEGVVKGFEAYWALRLVELGSTLAYTLLAFSFAASGAPYEAVAYAFLGSIVGRALATAVVAVVLARRSGLRPVRWDADDRADAFERARVMFAGKAVTSVQTQAPPLAIGALIGPAGVGIYDVLVRLPRFAKSVLGLLTSLLAPVAARIDESGDRRNEARLGRVGALFMPLVVLPLLAAGAAFSGPLLALWLGPEFRDYWPWHAAMFVVPALGVVVSFGSAMLMVRVVEARRLVSYAAASVALQFAVSFAFVPLYAERAFILGQVVAMLVFAPIQLRHLLRAQGVHGHFGRRLGLLVAFLAVAAVVTSLWSEHAIHDLVTLAVAGVAWVVACWTVLAFALTTADERGAAVRRLRGVVRR